MRVLFIVAALFAIVGIQHGYAADKIVICHANERENGNSDKPPFEEIEIAPQAVIAAHLFHQWGEDVIPQFEFDGVVYGPQGDQSLLTSHCDVPTFPTETPTNTPITETPTATIEETPTETATVGITPTMSGTADIPTETVTATEATSPTATATEEDVVRAVSFPNTGAGPQQEPFPTNALWGIPAIFLLAALSRYLIRI